MQQFRGRALHVRGAARGYHRRTIAGPQGADLLFCYHYIPIGAGGGRARLLKAQLRPV
jgi:hypothetical protein